MSSQRFCLHRSVYAIAVLTLAPVLVSLPASATPDSPISTELILNTTFRHVPLESKQGAVAAMRFQVEIPQAGLLALDLTVAGGVQPEPVLRILGPALRHNGPPSWRISQTPTTVLIETQEAGRLLVEVAAIEQGQILPAFKLRSAFQRADVDKEVDPWDDDLEGKKPPQGGSGTIIPEEICRVGEQDDHGDVWLCATLIDGAKTVAGVLHNGTGDDEDLFTFYLPVAAVVTVKAVSDSALQLVLRDHRGLALAIHQSESAGTPPRLTRALAAGRYVLEVEGSDSDDAAYNLTLHQPSRP